MVAGSNADRQRNQTAADGNTRQVTCTWTAVPVPGSRHHRHALYGRARPAVGTGAVPGPAARRRSNSLYKHSLRLFQASTWHWLEIHFAGRAIQEPVCGAQSERFHSAQETGNGLAHGRLPGPCGCGEVERHHGASMDPRLWAPLAWAFGLVVVIALAALGVALVRRRLGPGAEGGAGPAAQGRPDWITLLTQLQNPGPPVTSWIAWAPPLVAQARTCPTVLRAPLIKALGQAASQCRDPMVAASMSQVRAALAALPAG